MAGTSFARSVIGLLMNVLLMKVGTAFWHSIVMNFCLYHERHLMIIRTKGNLRTLC